MRTNTIDSSKTKRQNDTLILTLEVKSQCRWAFSKGPTKKLELNCFGVPIVFVQLKRERQDGFLSEYFPNELKNV